MQIKTFHLQKNERRSGFVLVMTLVILALAACAMARLANRSLSVVRRGTVAQRELQERWSMISFRVAFLDRGEELLNGMEAEQKAIGLGWPYQNEIRVTFELAGEPTTLVLADEEAKASLNTIHRLRPEALHGLLAQASVTSSIPIRLRPSENENYTRASAFLSWGQVVDRSRLEAHDQPWRQLDGLMGQFTCWGSGKLNLKRASDEALRTVLDGVLKPQQIEELIELRLGYTGELAKLLDGIDLSRRERIKLRPLLTDKSSTFSLSVATQTRFGTTGRLLVRDPTSRLSPEVLVFDW